MALIACLLVAGTLAWSGCGDTSTTTTTAPCRSALRTGLVYRSHHAHELDKPRPRPRWATSPSSETESSREAKGTGEYDGLVSYTLQHMLDPLTNTTMKPEPPSAKASYLGWIQKAK